VTGVFGDVLSQHARAERIDRPESETFLTLRLNGNGAVRRKIGEGKTPLAFSGYRVSAGQFIYSRIDARNGAFAVVPKELDGAVVSKDFPVFTIDHSRVDPRYLLGFVTTANFVDGIKRLSFGATNRQRVKEEIFLHLPLVLPPLEEQRRIAAILDKADELRTNRHQALAHLDTLTHSIFHSMFGDPVHADGQTALSELLTSIESGKSPVCEDRPALPDEWGVLKLSAVTRQVFDDSQHKALVAAEPDDRHEVRPGDLLFTRKNTPELVAAVALVRSTRPKLLLPDLIFRLRIADQAVLTPAYLHAVLANPRQRSVVQGLAGGAAASMSNISKSKLMTVRIPVPPIEHQRTFAARIAAVERLKEAHRKHLSELDTLFASLQHRAFKEELR
jgi:type I restriction enzyme S subunit